MCYFSKMSASIRKTESEVTCFSVYVPKARNVKAGWLAVCVLPLAGLIIVHIPGESGNHGNKTEQKEQTRGRKTEALTSPVLCTLLFQKGICISIP